MKNKKVDELSEENLSILERILLKTGNPRLATVLALDLLLVGVDTVSKPRNVIILNLWYIGDNKFSNL